MCDISKDSYSVEFECDQQSGLKNLGLEHVGPLTTHKQYGGHWAGAIVNKGSTQVPAT